MYGVNLVNISSMIWSLELATDTLTNRKKNLFGYRGLQNGYFLKINLNKFLYDHCYLFLLQNMCENIKSGMNKTL